jgi:hypothetical protein
MIVLSFLEWPEGGQLQLRKNSSHEFTAVAFEWMVSLVGPPPPTAVR